MNANLAPGVIKNIQNAKFDPNHFEVPMRDPSGSPIFLQLPVSLMELDSELLCCPGVDPSNGVEQAVEEFTQRHGVELSKLLC